MVNKYDIMSKKKISLFLCHFFVVSLSCCQRYAVLVAVIDTGFSALCAIVNIFEMKGPVA